MNATRISADPSGQHLSKRMTSTSHGTAQDTDIKFPANAYEEFALSTSVLTVITILTLCILTSVCDTLR
jgi:hypothetical protein